MKKQLIKIIMATLSGWILNYHTAHSTENSISNYIYNAELISETSDIKLYVQSGTKSDCRNKDNYFPRFIVILKHDNISNRLAHNWNKEILETLGSTHNEAKAFCPNVGNKTHIYTYYIENVLFQRDSNKIYILNNNPINTDYNDIIYNASQDELEQIYKSDARKALELVTITQGGHHKPKINRSAHASISDQDKTDFNPDTFTAIDHSILGVAESFRQQNLARYEQEKLKEWQYQNLAVDWPNSSGEQIEYILQGNVKKALYDDTLEQSLHYLFFMKSYSKFCLIGETEGVSSKTTDIDVVTGWNDTNSILNGRTILTTRNYTSEAIEVEAIRIISDDEKTYDDVALYLEKTISNNISRGYVVSGVGGGIYNGIAALQTMKLVHITNYTGEIYRSGCSSTRISNLYEQMQALGKNLTTPDNY